MAAKKEVLRKHLRATEAAAEAAKKVITSKELFDLEDKEAVSFDPKEQTDSFCQMTDEVLNTVSEFLTSKKSDPTSKNDAVENCMLNMMTLRHINRMTHYRLKKRKDSVAEERQKVEELYLQLQNLLYEVSHIQQEVTRCTDFKSADEDIDLIPVDQFYKEADLAISKPDSTRNDSHQQRLARLAWELETRKKLAKEIEQITDEKEEIEAETEAKQTLLDTLKPKLESLLEASKPVQEMLGMNYQKDAIQCQKARYLPKPLFYAYVQTLAYKDMFDETLTISVEGEIDEAKQFMEQKKNIEKADSDDETVSESGNSSKKLKKDLPTSQKSRRLTSSDENHTGMEHSALDELLAVFPMRLDYVIRCKSKARVTVQLFYVPFLDAVTTKCRMELVADVPRAIASAGGLLTDESLLLNLLDNDYGTVCPNPVGLARINHYNFNLENQIEKIGHCFLWCQRICGIQIPLIESNGLNLGYCKEGADTVVKQTQKRPGDDCNFLRAVTQAIKRRVLARLALQEQISMLEMLNAKHTPDNLGWFCAKEFSKMDSWKSVTFEEYNENKFASKFIDPETNRYENSWFFEMTISRDKAVLTALIHVDIDYPKTTPLFSVSCQIESETFTCQNSSFLKQLEKSINIDCVEKLPKEYSNELLTIQIRWMMSRLDLALGIFCDDVTVEHLHRRNLRGRDREMPMQYAQNENCFEYV